MLHVMPRVTVMPQASQGQCRIESGHGRLPSLVFAAVVEPAAVQCLVKRLTG